MTQAIEKLVLEWDAKLNRLDRQMKKAYGMVDKRSSQMERRSREAARRMNAAFGSLRNTAGALGVYLGVGQVTKFADSWTLVQNQLKATEQLIGVQLKSREQLLDLSERSRSDLRATAQLYTRVAASITHLTKEEKDYARITETVAKALKLGGATASEQANSMLQLSQAFQKGKLDGDEFRSVAENARVITQALADQLGVTRQEIIKLAADGKLTVDQLVAAILNVAPTLDEAFKHTIPTIDQAITKLNGRMTEYIGNLAESKGIAEAFRTAIYGLTDNIETVGDTALVAGAYILGAFGPKAIAALGRFGVALAGSTGGLTLLTGGLAAAYAALNLFGDEITVIDGEMATLADYGGAAWDVLSEKISEAGGAAKEYGSDIRDQLIPAIELISSALAGSEVTMADVAAGFKKSVNLIIGIMVGAAKTISITWQRLPAVIGDATISAMNGMIAALENGINAAVDMVNSLIDKAGTITQKVGVSLERIGHVDLGRFTNKFAGAGRDYGKALSDGFVESLTHDYLGNAGAALDEFADELRDRANAIAFGRTLKTTVKTEGAGKKPPRKNKGSDAKARANAYQQEVKSLQKRIEVLAHEAELVGKTAFETEKARKAFQLLQAAKEANIQVTAALNAKIDSLASGYAAAEIHLQQLQHAQEEASAKAEELASTFQDTTQGIISGLLEGRDAAEVFADALSNVADRLLDLSLDSVFQSFKSGGFGGFGGGLFGGAIIPGILHKGGTVGRDGYGHNRAVSPAVFANAPRYHQGGIAGLKPDEVPAILQKGELVIPKELVGKAGAGGNQTVFNIDARGAEVGVEQKIKKVLVEYDSTRRQNLPSEIRDAQQRGHI